MVSDFHMSRLMCLVTGGKLFPEACSTVRILSCLIDFAVVIIFATRKGNVQQPIHSNSTSCPKHQTGNGHLQLRRHKNKITTSEKPRGQLFPNRWP